MVSDFTAAWVPYQLGREFAAAAVAAMRWAEDQAARRGLPAVLVTDRKGEYHGEALFESYLNGRHASPRSPRVNVRPGAVIAHVPTPGALEVATRLARGNALVVVEHPSPWRLAGWAGVVGALDLDTGEPTTLDPQLHEHLNELVRYGNNGYARGYGRDGAHRVLADMAGAGLLDRDVVLSALSAYDISPAAQLVISSLIDKVAPLLSHR
ncbi:hypothetical protein ABZ399_30630 [Micromonospora aurantiaca]|uniref:hypothetical protein n=1 Tax=Micromonospora aurantiaca (nom. illeg.) TaxID=47850 RepID=UPI000FE1DB46|nr:hypothetical protein [Micromonospora provocatoris]